MSSFSRFQDINQKRGIANNKTNSSFIFNGYPTISILGTSGDEVTASVVNRQEKDLAYIYTHIDQELPIGSVWSAKGLRWLISEEIVIIKDVSWHKYEAILCNVEINGLWGYFRGPEESYINTVLKQDVVVQSQQKPILVLGEDILPIGERFEVRGRGWMVQEKDNFDTTGVTYYSLRASTLSKAEEEDVDFEVETIQRRNNSMKLISGEKASFTTEQGYFSTNCSRVEVINRTKTQVDVIIPFGIKELEVVTVSKGHRITTKYEVDYE